MAATGQKFEGTLDNIVSGTLELNREWLTLFGGFIFTEANFDSLDAAIITPTVEGSLGPAVQAGLISQSVLEETKEALSFSGDGVYYYYGFDVDYESWLLTYEYADYGIKDSGDTINEVWYVTGGKRFDNFVITATHGEYAQPIDTAHIAKLNPIVQPLASAVIGNLASQFYTIDQVSISYSLHPAALLKGELFSWDPLNSGENLTGVSFGIDLVF